MKIKIGIYGCDDSTIFEMEITQEQFELLKKIEARSLEVSTYGCMPTFQVEEIK